MTCRTILVQLLERTWHFPFHQYQGIKYIKNSVKKHKHFLWFPNKCWCFLWLFFDNQITHSQIMKSCVRKYIPWGGTRVFRAVGEHFDVCPLTYFVPTPPDVRCSRQAFRCVLLIGFLCSSPPPICPCPRWLVCLVGTSSPGYLIAKNSQKFLINLDRGILKKDSSSLQVAVWFNLLHFLLHYVFV